MNYIDETNLLRKNNGKTIDWANSIGCTILFEYQGEKGELELTDYYIKDGIYMVTVKFEGNNYNLRLSSLKNCSLFVLFKDKVENQKKEEKSQKAKELLMKREMEKEYYKQRTISKVHELNPNVEVISEYINYHKPIKCRCIKCMHTWETYPSSIFKESGVFCLACAGKVVNNYDKRNSLYYTHPELVIHFVNIQDAFEHVFNKGQREKNKFLCRCRDCGTFQEKTKGALFYGFNCSFCGDGVSYPNKIIFKLIDELIKKYDITDVEREFSPEWADGKRYDLKFCYADNGYIVEMDGAFHYMHNKLSGITLEESIEIDNAKTKKAHDNGYTLIRINCNYKNSFERFEHIKGNIEKSEISRLFDLNDVDWKAIDLYGLGSVFVSVCDEVNYKEDTSIELLMDKFLISEGAVRNYIKRGKEMGIIDKKKRIKNKTRSEIYDWYVFCGQKLANEVPFKNIGELSNNSLIAFGTKFNDASLYGRAKGLEIGELSKTYKNFRIMKIPHGEPIEEYINQLN